MCVQLFRVDKTRVKTIKLRLLIIFKLLTKFCGTVYIFLVDEIIDKIVDS